MSHDAEYEAGQLRPLIGGKIIGAGTDDTKESFFVKIKKGKKEFLVWIDSDQEGNDCGAVKIEELKH